MTAGRHVVLYVDDDEPNRLLMARLFSRHRPHDHLVFAGSVREAIDQARGHVPHLVVLDLTLPDGSGEDVLRVVKGELGVPVIIFSGYADEVTRERLMNQGADAYVGKPMDVTELLQAVESVIGPQSHGDS